MSLELKALIEEAYCIGCTKCIAVCPTDAIVGARRVLHTVIADHCTSCENCIQVCPTDCITLKTEAPVLSFEEERALTVRKQKRLGLVETKQLSIMQLNNQKVTLQQKEPELDRKKMVLDAIARVKQRKQTH